MTDFRFLSKFSEIRLHQVRTGSPYGSKGKHFRELLKRKFTGRVTFLSITNNFSTSDASSRAIFAFVVVCRHPASTTQRTRTELGRRAFSVAAPTVWNSLPAQQRLSGSIPTFKKRLKSLLFTSAFSQRNVLSAPLYPRTPRRYRNRFYFYYYYQSTEG